MELHSAYILPRYHDWTTVVEQADWNICYVLIGIFNVLKFHTRTRWRDNITKIKNWHPVLPALYQDIPSHMSFLHLLLINFSYIIISYGKSMTKYDVLIYREMECKISCLLGLIIMTSFSVISLSLSGFLTRLCPGRQQYFLNTIFNP